MRIHRLELSAIGPFPGTERIDFERLNEAGLFLLSGPTGAGKSTIFDAICFALYGSTTRSTTGKAKGLHSDFAPPGSAPYVELEFSVGSYRYLIRRSPEWQKPSTRAKSGWTQQTAQVLLSRRPAGSPGATSEDASEWEALSYRNDETGSLIQAIFGLTLQQFSQVVMLPQGGFARFLTASSNDREELLAKLFPVEVYASVRDVLKERAARAEEEVRGLAGEVATGHREVAELLQRLEVEIEPEDSGQTAGVIDLARAEQVLHDATQRAESLRTDSTREVSAARRTVEAMEKSMEEWAEHDRLLERSRAVQESDRTLKDRRAAAEAAEAAEPVAEAHERALLAGEETGRRRERLDEALDAMRDLLTLSTTLAGAEEPEQQAETDYWRDPWTPSAEADEAYGRLLDQRGEALRRVERTYAESEQLTRELADPTRQWQDADRRATASAARVDQLHRAAEAMDRESASIQEKLAALPDVADTRREAERILRLTRRAEEARRAVEGASREAEAAERRRRETAERVNVLTADRFRQAVNVLAADLEENQPCPVCGATDHPRPAIGPDSAGESAVDQRQIDQAVEERDQAEAAARTTYTRLVETRAGLKELDEQGALATVSEAEESDRRAREEHEKLEALQRRDEELRQERTVHGQELHAEEERAQSLAVEKAGLESRLNELRQRRDKVAEDLEGYPDRESIRAMSARVDRLKSLRAETAVRRGQVETAAESETEQRHTLRERLAASRFRDLDHVREARIRPAERAALAESIRRDEQEAARWDEAWKATWHQRFLERIASEDQRPDAASVAEARRAASEASARHEESVSRETLFRNGLETVRRVASRDRDLQDAVRRASEQATMLKDLSDVASGLGSENLQRMPLTTFILAAQLEEIAAAATVRLLAMTDGRYSLRHTDAAAGRGQKSGLGLEVFDAWTSEARPTGSLSGGETFMASLCLALGLADVVQARAGGIEIDTLFVDEGFGSLDEDTLDGVMDAIDGLRENGRVIGLVSHVADMKSRIPEHLKIKRAPQGSSVESTTA